MPISPDNLLRDLSPEDRLILDPIENLIDVALQDEAENNQGTSFKIKPPAGLTRLMYLHMRDDYRAVGWLNVTWIVDLDTQEYLVFQKTN